MGTAEHRGWVGTLLLGVAAVGCGGATTDSAVSASRSGATAASTNGGETPGSRPNEEAAARAPSPEASTHTSTDHVSFSGAVLYWTEANLVRASRLDGSGVVTIATGGFPTGIAVDAASCKVYWADNETDSITRANLDGSLPQVVYSNADPFSNPNGIAVDDDAGKIFWTESNVVKWAGLDGSSPAVLYTASFPTGVSVASGAVFFTDNMTESMSRGDYAGHAPTVFTLSTDAFSNPSAVAIAGDVFWAEAGGVYRMAQDGSARVQVATPSFPGGVAIEPDSRRIYFTDNIDDTVSYVSGDGTGRTVVYKAADAFANPRGVAIRPK